jgi:hypothetical protein
MKRAALVIFIVPVLFFAALLATPFVEMAQADSGRGGGRGGGSFISDGRGGGGGGGSFVGRSVSRGGGDAMVRSGRGFFAGQASRGVVVRDGSFVRQSGRDVVVRDGGRRDFVRGSHSHFSHVGHRHHGHFSTSVWIGPGWGWGVWDPFFYPYYYPYGYPYPYYYAPPSVVVQEPQEYISAPEAKEEPAGYWYYCKEANGYYPYVKRCPSGWMKVVPYQPPPDLGQDDDSED